MDPLDGHGLAPLAWTWSGSISAVTDNEEASRILKDVLAVKELDDNVWDKALSEAFREIPTYPSDARDEGWLEFWVRLRNAPEKIAQKFLNENDQYIKVKRQDGGWVFAPEVLLPGLVVNVEDHPCNQQILVDRDVHGGDEGLLKSLDVTDFPGGVVKVNDKDSTLGFVDWLSEWRGHYRDEVNSRASWNYLVPLKLKMPKGWKILPKLDGISNAKLTAQFLSSVVSEEAFSNVKFGHATIQSYPIIEVAHPLPWFLLKNGLVQVGDQAVRLVAVVSRAYEPALAKLPTWEKLQASLEVLKDAIPPVIPSDKDIYELWLSLIRALATSENLVDGSLYELWAGAARDKVVPQSLPDSGVEIPLWQVFVTSSPDLAHRARSRGHVVVILDPDTLPLWVAKGACNLADIMKPDWSEATGPVTPLLSVLPELTDVLKEKIGEMARCQTVAGLRVLIDSEPIAVPCLMWDSTLLIDVDQQSKMSRSERLQFLLAEMKAADWLQSTPEEALQTLGDAKVDELRAYVAQGSNLVERLLRAVNYRKQPLRQALGDIGTMDFLNDCSDYQIADLALAQLGPTILTEMKTSLKDEGLQPPSRWNTAEARSFVASIGFPEYFAASPKSRREPEEFISGPIELPPLHDFQEEVLQDIQGLVSSTTTRRRAVVSLPTGGGKTRLTVEAAVRLVLEPEGKGRSVLWIAQTDELCEQAVQAFRQVWINAGAQGTDLRVVRLWGGNRNPAVQGMDKPVVVVASIQTLNSRMSSDGLSWFQKPGLVVVDECHHAITKSYTNLLRFLDAEAPRPGAALKEESPILGLSATPFRIDDDESQRLARRFDKLFPFNQEELHDRLRRQGVLAKIDSEALDSGVGLTNEEYDQLVELSGSWEGFEFETLLEAINQRLAGSRQRNEKLINRIHAAEEGSILLFANSVLHAEEMAARLNLQGISAAAVSGKTPPSSRRYFLDRFQKGKIHVLCNHTVLSTGFDAPKTDMIIVSRAVFSPVRYMQMVGRGLRGEKNGGKARCRIVTVMDNLGRFQEQHPYHYCQKFFSKSLI